MAEHVIIGLRIPEKCGTTWRKLAAKDDRSFSYLVRLAIEEYLERRQSRPASFMEPAMSARQGRPTIAARGPTAGQRRLRSSWRPRGGLVKRPRSSAPEAPSSGSTWRRAMRSGAISNAGQVRPEPGSKLLTCTLDQGDVPRMRGAWLGQTIYQLKRRQLRPVDRYLYTGAAASSDRPWKAALALGDVGRMCPDLYAGLQAARAQGDAQEGRNALLYLYTGGRSGVGYSRWPTGPNGPWAEPP